jgi:tetratricopeptide (TPR) repeat protein
LIDTGKNAEAEKLLQKALTIFETRGEESDSAAEVLNSLSVLRSYQFDYQSASDLERRALAIWQKRHGPTYDYALVAMLNLAMYRFQRGDIAGAQTEFLALRDLRAGAKLPADTSVSLYLSAIERASGFPAKAKPWAEESVTLANAANGATSIDALQAREELAVVERDLRDWSAARKDVQFALDNFIASGGPQQPNVAGLRFLLAQLDYEESHCGRAQPVFEETMKRLAVRTDLDSVQQESAAQLLDGLCKQALHDTSPPSAAELIEAGRSRLLASGHAEPYLVNLARQAKVQ